MFREMHHMDRGVRARDLAEKMAQRRRQSLAVTSRFSSGTQLGRMLFALAVATDGLQAGVRT